MVTAIDIAEGGNAEGATPLPRNANPTALLFNAARVCLPLQKTRERALPTLFFFQTPPARV